jgi:peptide/nickel transport system substrate-binding protein
LRNSKSIMRLIALLSVLALIGAACGGGDENDGTGELGERPEVSTDVEPGGTLRMAGSSDVDYMDPSSMYYTLSFTLARPLFRTLVTYPGNIADPAEQNELVPDLAEDVGQANEDSTEWTYTIKEGVVHGKALGGEDVPGVTGEQITCEDFKYSVERLFIPSVGAGYPFYYDIIEGATDFQDGKADEISGVECTDERTIVFHLTKPAGDWDMRMAMPAMTPIARAAAEKYDKKDDSDYDNHVVSTGPYYIAEWTPGERILLERDDNWVAETDEQRKAYVDTIDYKMGFDNDVGVQKILDGEYDISMDVSPQGPTLEKVITDPELSQRVLNEPEGCTRYLFLNTTIEPFDDKLVREAVNLAIDRENIKRVFGGPTTGPIATSIVPPGLDGYLAPEDFNPFETGGGSMSGDMEAAKAKMAEAGLEGGWDEPITVVGASDPPHDKIFETVRADLEELGFTNIKSKLPKFPNQYTQFYSVPDSETAIGTSAGWCKDYNSAFTFLDPLFHSRNILPSGNQNYAEFDDPQMDELIDAAAAESDPAAAKTAWEEANRYATESGVWIPWSWDESVLIYAEAVLNPIYLTFNSHVDLANIGVDPELQN